MRWTIASADRLRDAIWARSVGTCHPLAPRIWSTPSHSFPTNVPSLTRPSRDVQGGGRREGPDPGGVSSVPGKTTGTGGWTVAAMERGP